MKGLYIPFFLSLFLELAVLRYGMFSRHRRLLISSRKCGFLVIGGHGVERGP